MATLKSWFKPIKLRPETCFVDSYSSRYNKDELVAAINESKVIDVFVSPETKTALKIQMSSSSDNHYSSMGVAVKLGDYKFLHREQYNGLFGTTIKKDCFKVTKTQEITALQKYLREVVDRVLGLEHLDNLTFNIRFYHTENMAIDIAENVAYKN